MSNKREKKKNTVNILKETKLISQHYNKLNQIIQFRQLNNSLFFIKLYKQDKTNYIISNRQLISIAFYS